MRRLDVADLVGVPFREGGRQARQGLDCWGLAVLALARLGVAVPAYGEVWWASGDDDAAVQGAIARETGEHWREVPGNELWQTGDMLLLRVAGRPLHIAVVTAWPDMVHACSVAGAVVVDRATSVRWRNRIVACYRHRDLEAVTATV